MFVLHIILMREMRGMRNLVRFVGVGVVAAGTVGGVIFASTAFAAPPSAEKPDFRASPAAETQDVEPALSCEAVRSLDQAAQERASVARSAIAGPEQWPPWRPGFEPNAPRPEPPIDPTTGLPKGHGQPPMLESRNVPTIADVGERPCGDVVEKIRSIEISGGGWICYLEDGRYASALTADAPEPLTSTEGRDELCRTFGFARSVQ